MADSTQLTRIKKLMQSLRDSTLTDKTALDQAIRDISGWSGTQALVKAFEVERDRWYDSHPNGKPEEFLQEVCGITLDNADTGAITGADAGNSTVKTAESVIEEVVTDLLSPTSYMHHKFGSNRDLDLGVDVRWDSSVIDALKVDGDKKFNLFSDKEKITTYIRTWWLEQGLKLINESYGMDFTTTDGRWTINLKFEYNTSDMKDSLAWVDNTKFNEQSLDLTINTYYYHNILNNDNGKASKTDTDWYLDRIFAHELTHAVMIANLESPYYSLPKWFREGAAELVHGADDYRKYDIINAATKGTSITALVDETNAKHEYYATGYMLLRYFAQNANSVFVDSGEEKLDNSLCYDEDITTLLVKSVKGAVRLNSNYKFTVTRNGNKTTYPLSFAKSVNNIDASSNTGAVDLVGNDLRNVISASQYGDTVYGLGGNDEIYDGAGNDLLYGGDGHDKIYARSGQDEVYGGYGDDTIIATKGNKKLVGGQGNDSIQCGDGRDTLWYSQGDGNDVIQGFNSAQDTIRYESGSLTKVVISGKDAFLYNGSGRQKLMGKGVKGQYANVIAKDGKTTVKHNFGTYAAANTWSVDAGQIGKQGFHGSSKTDTLTITGKNKANINLGTASLYTSIDNVDASKVSASMKLTGSAATNVLKGGSGADTISGVNGSNKLYGNGGNDSIVGGSKADYIEGGAGNDTIKGNAGADKLFGGTGNDSLYGGTGNDTLSGGVGNDIFYYAKGDGNDTITDFTSGKDKIRYTSGSLTKVQISSSDVLLYNGTGYQRLTGKAVKGQYADIVAANGKTTVRHNFGKNATANTWNYATGQGYHGSNKIDTLKVSGGTSRTISLNNTSLYTSIDNVNAASTTGALTIRGTAANNSIQGGTAADILYAGAGNDTLKGGNGSDKLYAQSGNNLLMGEAGNDYLEGGSGTDTLRGGAGNDTIKCGKGVDKIQFYKGDGKDIIQNAAKNDILYLYNISDLKKQASFKMSGSNLVMSFNNNKNDSITISNWKTSGLNTFVTGKKTYSLTRSGNRVRVK